MFMGQRPDDGQSPIFFHSIAARHSLASHPAAQPAEEFRTSWKN